MTTLISGNFKGQCSTLNSDIFGTVYHAEIAWRSGVGKDNFYLLGDSAWNWFSSSTSILLESVEIFSGRCVIKLTLTHLQNCAALLIIY